MIFYHKIGMCVLLNAIVLCTGGELGFGYQESEETDPAKQNALNKKPVEFSARCKSGELYYPGDQADDWVCDCRPGFIYMPSRSQCFEAHRQGPCGPQQQLVLPENSFIPQCVANPCGRDKFVKFMGKCYELDKPGPCPLPELPNLIGVNESTLKIQCTKGLFPSLHDRFGENDNLTSKFTTTSTTTTTTVSPIDPNSIYYNKPECFVGGIRWSEARCPNQNDNPVTFSL